MSASSTDLRPTTAPETAWHVETPEAVFEQLATSPDGLTPEEARRRLEDDGPNRLEPPKPRSSLRAFLHQFHNVLIYLLLIAGAMTLLLREFVDAGVILAVVIINAIIGFIQEGKAERALDAIRKMLSHEAVVIRGGRRMTIRAEGLVVGDVVALQPGDKVPADLRLFRVRELNIEEAVLTGESVPVSKTIKQAPHDAPLGDRTNLAYSGTLVTSGQGFGIVVSTGKRTEIGRISSLVAGVHAVTTPLLRQITVFGHVLSAGIVVIALGTFGYGVVVHGNDPIDMFMAAVGLAVAAIPEGLPAILTITLAIGVQRMAARHAIIRHLPAVDTLGSITVICSDKTGTLTRNEMTVKMVATPGRLFDIGGAGYAPQGGFTLEGREVIADDHEDLMRLVRAAFLCNESSVREKEGQWLLDGDPTEGALVTLGLKAGFDLDAERKQWPTHDTIPFESQHRFMATLHHSHDGQSMVFLKGASERLLLMCVGQGDPRQPAPLDRAAWERRGDEMASQGQRVLAIACKPSTPGQTELKFADVEKGLVLLGLVSSIDPPRQEAILAVRQCRAAGIRVKMITGDHARTASAIGLELGIGDGKTALTGQDIEQFSEKALREGIRDVDVFARVSPEHKLRLVEAIQSDGQVVAMTGDGVNDAPALKRADVGVAMGHKGTEAAKEAADMVLTDDNFASIAHAVEEGRTVYDNLRKAIVFILPTNMGQALMIIGAVVMGVTLPITPVQILWVNMVTSVTLALALAFEPPERGVMKRPPRRPGEPLLSGFFVWRILLVGWILWSGTFGMFIWVQRDADVTLDLARTVAVNTLVLFEIFYLLNTRFLTAPAISRGIMGNRYIYLAIALVMSLQLLYTYMPLSQRLFHTEPLDPRHWLVMVPVAATVFVIIEFEKWILRRMPALHARVVGGHRSE